MKIKHYILSLFFIIRSIADSQVPTLVKDIATGTLSGVPSLEGIAYNNRLIFSGTSVVQSGTLNISKSQLWSSDGTPGGTFILKDNLAWSTKFTPFNNKVFFSAKDSLHGIEIFFTDGTSTGTKLLKDINTGTLSAYPDNFFQLGSFLFFTADNGTQGVELWKTDGTTIGTTMVKDINPGTGVAVQSHFKLFNGALFFEANDGVHGDELWRTDGTTSGTYMVKDIHPSGDAFPGWGPSCTFNNSIALGNLLLFTAYQPSLGIELWKTDGTINGTSLLKEIRTGTASSMDAPNFCAFNNKIYFFANNGINGIELWMSDGTTSGTIMVEDLRSGAADGCLPNTWLVNSGGGKMFFQGINNTSNFELFSSDGTTGGATALGGPVSFPWFTSLNGIFYIGMDELWRSDGTIAGTYMLKDVNPSGGSSPSSVNAVNGKIYYSAQTPATGFEFYQSDGTVAGTVLLGEINPGPGDSRPQGPEVVIFADTTIFFSANDGVHGFELFAISGGPLVSGIKKQTNTIQTIIFPNPNKGFFDLILPQSFINTKLEVYNMLGEIILIENIKEVKTKIDLSTRTPGIYILKTGSITKKVIIE